jgi:hypothetical protein
VGVEAGEKVSDEEVRVRSSFDPLSSSSSSE